MSQRSAARIEAPLDEVHLCDFDADVDDAWNIQRDYLTDRDARWRRPEQERRWSRRVLLAALLVQLLLLWGLRQQMFQPVPLDDRSDAIQIRLISPADEADPVVLPELQAPASAERIPADASSQQDVLTETVPPRENLVAIESRRPSSAVTSVAAQTSSPVRVAPSTSAIAISSEPPAPHLYETDGRLRVDPDLATRSAAPGPNDFVAPQFVAPAMMRHRSPLPYKATVFNDTWPSDHETLLGEWVRHSTRSYTARTPWGGQVSCTVVLFFGGCGWGYAPPNPEGLKRMRFNPPFKPELAPPGTQPPPTVTPPPTESVEGGAVH